MSFFTPTFEVEGDGAGRLNVKGVPTERGWPQARIDADIRCSFCGHGFKAGDHVIARLAIPPAEATWAHNECGRPQRLGTYVITPDGRDRSGLEGPLLPALDETIFSAMRSFDDHARRRDE